MSEKIEILDKIKCILLSYPPAIKNWKQIFKQAISKETQPCLAPLEHKYQAGNLQPEELFSELLGYVRSETFPEFGVVIKIEKALRACNLFGIADEVLRLEKLRRLMFYKIPKRTSPFCGRNSQLQKLKDIYDDPGGSLVMLTGITGMGKTELITQFLHTCDKCKTQCIWVDSGSSDILKASIRELRRDALFAPESIPLDVKSAFNELAEIVRDHGFEKSIIVFDNIVHDIFPSISDIIEILVSYNFKVVISSCETIKLTELCARKLKPEYMEITELTDQEATEFVNSRLKDEDKNNVLELCKLVDNYPYLLEQAVVDISFQQQQNPNFTIHQYVTGCDCDPSVFGKLRPTLLRVKEICSRDENNFAWDMLQILAYVDNSDVNMMFLQKIFQLFDESSEKCTKSITLLKSLSLIKHEHFRINTVLQKCLKNELSSNLDRTNVIRVLDKLSLQHLDKTELAHVQCMWLNCYSVVSHSSELHKVAESIFITMDQKGLYSESIEFAEKAIDLYDKHMLEGSDDFKLILRNRMALSLQRIGKDDKSLEILNKLFEDRESNGIYTTNEQTLNIIHGIANAYFSLKAYDSALEKYEEVLEGRRKSYSVDRNIARLRDIKRTEANIASIIVAQGRPREALSTLKEILAWQKEYDRESAIQASHKMGYCYFQTEEFEKAKIHFLYAYNERKRLGQMETTKFLITKFYLGQTYFHLGQQTQGLVIIEQVYPVQVKILKSSHEDTISTLDCIKEFKKIVQEQQSIGYGEHHGIWESNQPLLQPENGAPIFSCQTMKCRCQIFNLKYDQSKLEYKLKYYQKRLDLIRDELTTLSDQPEILSSRFEKHHVAGPKTPTIVFFLSLVLLVLLVFLPLQS